ncbi:chaperone modulator CbpM [Parapedobacter sp.]
MGKTKKISVEECCTYYSIEASFIFELDERGLIELSRSGKSQFITDDQLPNLEKYMRLHYELEINMAGMEAIRHLLERMKNLQQEVKRLQELSANEKSV